KEQDEQKEYHVEPNIGRKRVQGIGTENSGNDCTQKNVNYNYCNAINYGILYPGRFRFALFGEKTYGHRYHWENARCQQCGKPEKESHDKYGPKTFGFL